MIGDQLLRRKVPNKAQRKVALAKKARESKFLERPLVLDCECGEKLVLIGQEDNNYWRWGNTLLECGGCEEKFVLL
jgi:hypothetical protein